MSDKPLGSIAREQVITLFPQLDALHEDTTFQAFREYKPLRDEIEVSVFFREPDNNTRWRIEAVWNNYDPDYGLRPNDVRVTYWGEAEFYSTIMELRNG